MVIVLAVEHQTLIPHLLRCDVEKVKSILASYEQEGGIKIIEPVREKTNNLGLPPGPTQIKLYSHRRYLEALNFG